MKHIILTVLVCLNVAAFIALYQRTTEIVGQALLDGLSRISVSTECSVPRDLLRTSMDARLHKFPVR